MAKELKLICPQTEEHNGNSYAVFDMDHPLKPVRLRGKRLVGLDMLTAWEKAAEYRAWYEERYPPTVIN